MKKIYEKIIVLFSVVGIAFGFALGCFLKLDSVNSVKAEDSISVSNSVLEENISANLFNKNYVLDILRVNSREGRVLSLDLSLDICDTSDIYGSDFLRVCFNVSSFNYYSNSLDSFYFSFFYTTDNFDFNENYFYSLDDFDLAFAFYHDDLYSGDTTTPRFLWQLDTLYLSCSPVTSYFNGGYQIPLHLVSSYGGKGSVLNKDISFSASGSPGEFTETQLIFYSYIYNLIYDTNIVYVSNGSFIGYTYEIFSQVLLTNEPLTLTDYVGGVLFFQRNALINYVIAQNEHINDLENQIGSQSAVGDTFNLVKSGLGGLTSLLDVEIAPYITIGMVLTIPFVIAVIGMAIRLIG